MKRKFHGSLSISVVLAACCAAFAFYYGGYWQSVDNGGMHFNKVPPGITIPDPALVKQVQKLRIQMLHMKRPSQSNTTPVDLAVFGYMPTMRKEYPLYKTTPDLPQSMDYTLTFAFVSDSKRFCIINDILYTEGEGISDGARILKIEPDQVLVQKKNTKKWILPSESNGEPDQKDKPAKPKKS